MLVGFKGFPYYVRTVSLTKEQKLAFFDRVAPLRDRMAAKGRYYHERLAHSLAFHVPEGASVLCIGCGTGNLLNALKPKRGVGIDFSLEMIAIARRKYPEFEFRVDDFDNLGLNESFDVVIVEGALSHVDDVQKCFANLRRVCSAETRVIVVYFNYIWEPILKFAEKIGWRLPRPRQHWLPGKDMANLLELAGFDVVKTRNRCLVPLGVPLLADFANAVLANLPGFKHFCLNELVVARLAAPRKAGSEVTCSVVIPCRNEAGNIEQAVARTPVMGAHTEIIFVEGGSSDDTLSACEHVKATHPERDITVLIQDGKGKGDAVRKGFSAAKGDVLMILDADLTVPPEELPKFFEALVSGKAEFVNGSRLVYQMEARAMRFLNLIANKFFSMMFSWLLEQRIRDTLCGTKVLWRSDYKNLVAGRAYFGDFDPFGDFDLLFGAAKLCLDIVEVPIHYRERTYGETNINRFRHGWMLLKMTVFALRKIKFVG